MKKITLVVFILSGFVLIKAHTITDSQLIGKWKLVAAKAQGVHMDLTSPENLMKSFYESLERLAPDKILSKDDSANVEAATETMRAQFSKVHLDFYPGNRCSGVLELDGENDSFTGKYKVKNNVLTMDEEGKAKPEKVQIEMPDNDTLVLKMVSDGKNVEMVFNRRF